jgi:hypothetical protein
VSPANSIEFPSGVALVAAIVLSLSLWAMSFSHSCVSDGCIGVVIPAGGAAIALALQLLVVIPVAAIKRHRGGSSLWPSLAVWIAASVAAFAIPLAFVK